MLNIDTDVLLILIPAVLAGHVMLMFMGTRWGVLFVLLAGFVVLSPISAATELPFLEAAKYARVYTTLLAIFIGLLTVRRNVGSASRMLILFLLLYALGALWSDRPVNGLIFKGIAVMAVVAGVFVGSSSSFSSNLLRGMQLPLYAGALFGLLIIAHLAANPNAISHIGRLAAWGMNPNRIGQTAAPLALIALYFALLYPRRLDRIIGWMTCSALLITILYTGSRASLGMFVVGGAMIALNLSRQFGRLVFAGLGILIIFGIAMEFLDITAATRITEVSLDTREDFWQAGYQQFRSSPWVGTGWAFSTIGRETGSTLNHLSIYLQTLVELGLVGIGFLTTALLLVVRSLVRSYRATREIPWLKNLWFLLSALVAGILAHGFFESSVLMGSTINTILLGFAVGLSDRLPQIAEYDRSLHRPLPTTSRADLRGISAAMH